MRKAWLSFLAAIPLFGASLPTPPAPPDPLKVEQRIAKDIEWFRRTLKVDKCDASATEALTAAAQLWSDDPKRPGNEQERAWQASHRAIQNGCDDGLVQYIHARMYVAAVLESTDEAIRLAREAASALDRSSHHPMYKLLGHIRAADAIIDHARAKKATSAPGAEEQLDAAEALWPKVAESPDIPHELVLGAFQTYLDRRRDLHGDRRTEAGPILAAYEARAKKSAILQLLRARLLIDSAWDARGHAFIDKTTETAQKVFASRLEEAAGEVMKARALDPASPSIAPLMLAVALGIECGRDQMDSWFRYGLAVDPGSLDLWFARLHHLEPRWNGSAEEMLEVGREALETKQWSLRVPFVLIFAHHQLAEETKNETYFDANVCRDIRAVYDPYLKLHPDAHYERSGYAFLLYRCGDHAGANREIQRLGANRRIGPFTTRAKFDEIRIEVATTALTGNAANAKKKLERNGRKLTVPDFHQSIFLGEAKNVALYLEAGMPVDAGNEKGVTALHVAAGENNPKILEMLLKAGGNPNAATANGQTPLSEAADDGAAKNVELLIKAGADVNARDNSNETALHHAAGHSDATIVRQLLRAGADVDAKDRSGATPLHEAVDSDSAASVQALLEAGANPNARNGRGSTPLEEAKQFKRQNVIALLENAKNVVKTTTVTPAASGDPVAQLKKMGITSPDGPTLLERVNARDARAVALLLAAGVKPDFRDNTGRPALWNAIENKDAEMVKALLAGGADPNDPGKHVRKEFDGGETLVMQAVDSGEPEILRALVAAGAKPDVANDYGSNALMSACMFGKAEMVKILIEGKANVNAVDKAGTPVLWMAVRGKSAEAVEAVLNAGATMGPKWKKLIVEQAAESGDEKIRALIGKAAGATVQAKAPPPLPAKKPASEKKAVTAKQFYDMVLPEARKWEEDADLVDLTTLRDAELQLDGRSHNWMSGFYSRSAQKLLQLTYDDGKLSRYETVSNELRRIPVDDETIFDTKQLSDMAVEAGASKLTTKGVRPTVGLVFNPARGPLWYFNYSDPETRKNVMTIVFNAKNGEIVLNDAK